MISPPLFSVVANRHGLQLRNCDLEIAKYRYCDAVLVMDNNLQPWQEFFVRATILHPNKDWQLFTAEFNRYFDVIVYGYVRLPIVTVVDMLKSNGLMIDVKDDICYKRSQLE